MLEETRQAYISQAKHFINSRLGTDNPHIQDVRSELIAHAINDNPGVNSWRKKRRTLEVYYENRCILEEAIFIKSIQFPKDALKRKTSTVMKKVTNDDFTKLLDGCMKKKSPDLNLVGALTVAYITGCRPSEMMSIQLLAENSIYIEGSKKTEDGLRGMDRHLYLDDKNIKIFSIALTHMKKELKKLKPHQTEMDAVSMLQHRLDSLYRKLFPKRKKHITFKSFRHQLGSDLKSSGMPRINCAAILGHQSVNSINKYGDSRSGKGRLHPIPSQKSIDNVRVTEIGRADFKQHLIDEGKRNPDKKPTSSAPVYRKAKIGGSMAYYL